MSKEITGKPLCFVRWSVGLWCIVLITVPIGAAAIPGLQGEPNPYWVLNLLVFGIPGFGLVLAIHGVVSPSKNRFSQWELNHIRSLAGIHGGIGLAYIATLGVFEQSDLELHMTTASVVWVAPASVYFVAFWASARIEERSVH